MHHDQAYYRQRIEQLLETPLEDLIGYEEHHLGQVTWIGRPGYSASIEPWIKKVWELLKKEETLGRLQASSWLVVEPRTTQVREAMPENWLKPSWRWLRRSPTGGHSDLRP